MFDLDKFKYSHIPVATVAGAGTAYLSIDTKGYERVNGIIDCGTNATTSAVFTTLKWGSHDTVTSPSSMTDIVALTGATATTTSAGFVLPTSATLENGGLVEFQIDLRKDGSKRYYGLTVTPTQSLVVGAIAICGKPAESGDTAAKKVVTNNSNTNAASVVQVIQNLS